MRLLLALPGLAFLQALAILPVSADIILEPAAAVANEGGRAGDEADDAVKEEPKLSDAQAKWFTDFAKKASGFRKKEFEKEAAESVRNLAEQLKLEAATESKLKAAMPKVVEATLTAWEGKFGDWLKPFVIQAGDVEGALQGWEPEQLAARGQGPADVYPEETPEWTEVLKGTLSPEQLAAWAELEKAHLTKLREEMADYLATCETQASETLNRAMDSVMRGTTQFINLDAERTKQLKAASDEAIKLTLAGWKVRVEKQLLNMGDKARSQIAQNGSISVNFNEKENKPQLQKVWKQAVASILTEIERKQIKELRNETRSRRAEALAMVLILDLDRFLGFSEAQRDALTKLAGPPLLKLPDGYYDDPDGAYFSLDSGAMLTQLKTLTDEQLSAHLPASQIKRLREVNASQLSRQGYARTKLDVGKIPPVEEMDELEVERLLSTFLHREARKMKQSIQGVMEAEVDSIVRIASPAPEAVAVLRTAAKGAAEEMSLASINNLTSWVRSQFQNIKPADVPARMQSLYNPYFSDRRQQPDAAVWTAAVERLLAQPQREVWKQELEKRAVWKHKALSAMVTTSLERLLSLAPDKRAALQLKLTGIIAKYETDFANFFSSGWHLQGYYSMVPLAMLSEKEMEEFFDKKQIVTVREKGIGNAAQYAEMIQQNHAGRTGNSNK